MFAENTLPLGQSKTEREREKQKEILLGTEVSQISASVRQQACSTKLQRMPFCWVC